jgi:hypothetical protein
MRTTYRYDRATGQVVPVSGDRQVEGRVHIVGDIAPYEDPTRPGHWITSRSHHRENLRLTGCIEAGNEKNAFLNRRLYDE